MRNPIIQLMIQKLIQSICRSSSHTHIPPKQFLSVVVPLGPTQFNQPLFFIGILFGLSLDTLTSISTYAPIHHSGWTQFLEKKIANVNIYYTLKKVQPFPRLIWSSWNSLCAFLGQNFPKWGPLFGASRLVHVRHLRSFTCRHPPHRPSFVMFKEEHLTLHYSSSYTFLL